MISTEANRKEAVQRLRKNRERDTRMLETATKEMWELWHKTDCQIVRDCIITGIVALSRELEKIENRA